MFTYIQYITLVPPNINTIIKCTRINIYIKIHTATKRNATNNNNS